MIANIVFGILFIGATWWLPGFLLALHPDLPSFELLLSAFGSLVFCWILLLII